MTLPTIARRPYAARPAPPGPQREFLNLELRNIQQAIPTQKVRVVWFESDPQFQVVLATDDTLLVDATGGATAITLPAPDQVQFLRVTIKRVNSGANAVTVVGTVDGATDPTLATQYATMTIQSSGSAWFLISSL